MTNYFLNLNLFIILDLVNLQHELSRLLIIVLVQFLLNNINNNYLNHCSPNTVNPVHLRLMQVIVIE